jgi:NADPH-dependent curcumin reductase CurA
MAGPAAHDGAMTSPVNTRVLLDRRPDGPITADLFRVDTVPVPEPAPGDVVVRNVYLSCDPYLVGRIQSVFPVGEPVAVRVVGVVHRSANPAWPEGTIVWGFLAWEEYTLVPGGRGLTAVDPSLGPISHAISVLGMPGLTAYVGAIELGRPTPGETFYVSSAAGAVGSVAGQLAHLAGARVVGSAGSAAKCAHVVDVLRFDACFDHRAVPSIGDALDEHCPDGIDVYFDNVGGEHLEAAIGALRTYGRIVACGSISRYNDAELAPGPRNMFLVVTKRLKMQGFIISDHYDRYDEFLEQTSTWLRDGRLQYRETIVEGIENAPRAFLGLLRGENIGKMLVKVGPGE